MGLSVFLDLKKAFDTVDHNILLEKIAIYGILKERHIAGWSRIYQIGPSTVV